VSLRVVAFAVVVSAHLAALAAALAYAPTRRMLAEAAPVFVRFIDAPEVPVVAPDPPPMKPPEVPKPVARVIPKPKPVAPTKPVAPATMTAAPVPSSTADHEAPPAPATSDPSPPAPVVQAAAAASAASVVPPGFQADYLHNPAPAYPALSRRLGEEGRVLLRVYVDPDGLPARVELRTSSGFPRLDDVALETVRRWRFVPARQGENPVAAWVLVPIAFSLKG
jgi:protein TonB